MNRKSLCCTLLLVVMIWTGGLAVAGPGGHQGVMLEPETLQEWMDKGWLDDNAGNQKVVLLDVSYPEDYANGHLPYAQFWNISEQAITRVEGPAPAVNMVLDGATMDALVQQHGIDKNTTVVITSALPETDYPSRTYFLFRYWGFPKKNIKVLNGFNGVWDQAELTQEPFTLRPSDYSVKERAKVLVDERASLAEMIMAVEEGVGVAVDMRGNRAVPGGTPGVYKDVLSDYVVFEGRMKGGTFYSWKNFNVDYDNADVRFKSAEEIAEDLLAIGLDGSQTVYSYCRTGYIGSVGYFVLDAILGWEVMLYDGSWAQWGKMSDMASVGGELPPGSLWATDNSNMTEPIIYNADYGLAVETLRFDPAAHAMYPDPYDPCANQVELEDLGYVDGKKHSSLLKKCTY